MGNRSLISFIEGSCYGPASYLAGPTRTSCGLAGPADGLCGGLSQCRQCTRQRGAKADELVVLKYKKYKAKEGKSVKLLGGFVYTAYGARAS